MRKRGLVKVFAFSFFVILLCVMSVSPALAHLGTPINSSWATIIPTIDGTISTGEWTDATVQDFTLEMRSRIDGSLNETLDARFYVKNNWTHIYAAVQIFDEDYNAKDMAAKYDGLALLFEDDHDGVLSVGDNGEGATTWTGSPFYSKNDLYYSAGDYWDADFYAGKTNDGALAWSHTNPIDGAIGDYTFEMMIPLVGSDGDSYDLDITTLPETVGFKIWFQELTIGTDGVYPDDPAIAKNVEETTDGATFGDLIIHPLYTLTITTTTGGTTDPAPGEYQHPYGTVVDVLATPDVCYEFDHWELDSVDVGSANPISVTMDQNHTLHAVFKLIYYTLTITTTTGGTTDPAPGTYSHPCGSVIDVLAIPYAGYNFDHWVLDGSDAGSVNPISVTMDQNHTLHAVFEEIPPPPPECVGGEMILPKVTEPATLSSVNMYTWIGLASLMTSTLCASIVYVKHRKKRQN